MPQYLTALDMAYIVISLLGIARLITYQRAGATFKRSKSFIAWLLLCSFAWLALTLITGKACSSEFPQLAFPLLLLITGLIYYTHGNIAALFRIITRVL